MNTVFLRHSQPVVAVQGSTTIFPVRRIYCVGRNYAGHAREMGIDAGLDTEREPPFFFCKPADAIVAGGGAVLYPPQTQNYHHEVELVVAIGDVARNISLTTAGEVIFGYAVGFDMTRRDLQSMLRKQGLPWELAKAFDQSAPIGAIHPVSRVGHLERGAIWLTVNGVERQRDNIAQMIWTAPEIIVTLSQYVSLQPGDLIFTGTPAGVGPVVPGDVLVGGIEGLGELHVTIVDR